MLREKIEVPFTKRAYSAEQNVLHNTKFSNGVFNFIFFITFNIYNKNILLTTLFLLRFILLRFALRFTKKV